MKPLAEEATARTRSQTLFGELMLQTYAAVILYEQLLRSHKHLTWVLEIGTATGSLSLFWATWMTLRQGRFLTIDNGAAKQWLLKPSVEKAIKQLGGEVIRGDCFNNAPRLNEFMGNKPGLLFCDGGDKPREMRTFGPACSKGSVVVAHDYPLEVTDADIASVSEFLKLYEPWNSTSLAGKTLSIVMKVV